MALRIAFIGAGSCGFTRRLVGDILTVPEFADTTFAFMDINERNLDAVTQLVERDIDANKLPARIVTTTDRRAALEAADYVINTTRIGGMDAFEMDVEIPLKYGIDQCVGDTLCAGGIMYGQRNIPAILDFCKDIGDVAKPGALFLNYANPMAMNTWVALKYGQVNTVGLCHGVQHSHQQIATVIEVAVNGDKAADDPDYVSVSTDDVSIAAAGINHQTWFIKAHYNGEDWLPRLLDGFEKHPKFRCTEKVRIDMLRRFGHYSTESNGHLSEYVPWYRKRPDEIPEWIDMSSWMNGETAGYLRVCNDRRDWYKTYLPMWMKEEPQRYTPDNRSLEHGSYIIEAIETGRVYRGHFNVRNNNCISNLPADAIVEVPGFVDSNGINTPAVGDLPLGCAAVCDVSINVQRLAVEAAIHGDVELLKQAMMLDPLVGAVCNPPEISQLVDEMLIAQAGWLPQYTEAIPAASARLNSEQPLGIRDGRAAASQMQT